MRRRSESLNEALTDLPTLESHTIKRRASLGDPVSGEVNVNTLSVKLNSTVAEPSDCLRDDSFTAIRQSLSPIVEDSKPSPEISVPEVPIDSVPATVSTSAVPQPSLTAQSDCNKSTEEQSKQVSQTSTLLANTKCQSVAPKRQRRRMGPLSALRRQSAIDMDAESELASQTNHSGSVRGSPLHVCNRHHLFDMDCIL